MIHNSNCNPRNNYQFLTEFGSIATIEKYRKVRGVSNKLEHNILLSLILSHKSKY